MSEDGRYFATIRWVRLFLRGDGIDGLNRQRGRRLLPIRRARDGWGMFSVTSGVRDEEGVHRHHRCRRGRHHHRRQSGYRRHHRQIRRRGAHGDGLH